MISPIQYGAICVEMEWLPVIENDLGQERFLSEDPNILFRDSNFTKVPTIAGITEHEYAEAGQCKCF